MSNADFKERPNLTCLEKQILQTNQCCQTSFGYKLLPTEAKYVIYICDKNIDGEYSSMSAQAVCGTFIIYWHNSNISPYLLSSTMTEINNIARVYL